MKKTLVLILLITCAFLAGCTKSNQDNASYNEFRNFPYFKLSDPVAVYDEYEKLSGFIVLAFLEGGSESIVDVYFISNSEQNLKMKKIDMFSDTSLGYFFFERNKDLYLADYIWGKNESHYGCHKIVFKKIKYVNNEFLVTREKVSLNKYAFDLGDAQGKCEFYPGPEEIMKKENLFE